MGAKMAGLETHPGSTDQLLANEEVQTALATIGPGITELSTVVAGSREAMGESLRTVARAQSRGVLGRICRVRATVFPCYRGGRTEGDIPVRG